jgi:hypothetical protein
MSVVMLLQVTGDILSLTTDIGGPVLPGFGPTVFAERANAATGLAAATAVTGLGRAARAGSGSAAAGAGAAAGCGSMPQAVVDFLMPPQAINADIVSQVSQKPQGWHDATPPQQCCSSNAMNTYSCTTAGAAVQLLHKAPAVLLPTQAAAESHDFFCNSCSPHSSGNNVSYSTFNCTTLLCMLLCSLRNHAAHENRCLWLQETGRFAWQQG